LDTFLLASQRVLEKRALQNDRMRILEWIGEDTLLKTWKTIEPFIEYERHRRNNKNFVLHYEQLMKEFEKEKETG